MICHGKFLEFDNGKIRMGCRKNYRILVTLFLILSVFANSSFAAICLCGNACSHGLQTKENTKLSLLFHLQCSGNKCKSCDLEKGKSIKASNGLTDTQHLELFDTASILSTRIQYNPGYHTLIDLNTIYAIKPASFFPIYLQNLCLRY
jgi:hypothetical protein